MTSLFQTFLKNYQSEQPAILFLNDALTKVLLKKLLQIFAKEEKLVCFRKDLNKDGFEENLKFEKVKVLSSWARYQNIAKRIKKERFCSLK